MAILMAGARCDVRQKGRSSRPLTICIALAIGAASFWETLNFVGAAPLLRGRGRAASSNIFRQQAPDGSMTFDDIEIGQKYTGTITGIRPAFAFVDIGAHMPGFLHISQVRGYRIEDIQNEISEGQEVDVWVSKKEQDGSGKFAVTMVESNKMGQPQRRPPSDLTPFMNFDSSEWIPAKISGVQGFGAFAEATLPTGEVGSGLIHITQIAEGFVQDVSEHVQVGQEVKVRVVKVENGKLALSMKEEGGDRGFVEKEKVDYSPFAEVSADTWCKSTVKTITNFGAFVDVQLPGADTSANALLHISQMDTGGFIDSVEDHFSEGQEVDVRILSVDLDAGKMSVTMKKDDLDGEME